MTASLVVVSFSVSHVAPKFSPKMLISSAFEGEEVPILPGTLALMELFLKQKFGSQF